MLGLVKSEFRCFAIGVSFILHVEVKFVCSRLDKYVCVCVCASARGRESERDGEREGERESE